MYDVNAHLAATDTPNNLFTRTLIRVLMPPTKLAIKTYFAFGMITGNERIVGRLVNLINEHNATAK